ncbi:MAG TPA: hypothetical protein DCM04_07400 [Saprospirales bacterium]|nr:hypothetical protein [Saprospirales bacterium]|tara:strand:+ start:282 stop:656 length:375 start_codon:yes stop_codon:yes gene_type:complete
MKVSIEKPNSNSGTQNVDVQVEDWDTWNVDITLSHIIVPLLRKYKERNHGYPEPLDKEKWDNMLDSMIYSFEFKTNNTDVLDSCLDSCVNNHSSEDCKECMERAQAKVSAGFLLFGMYFEHLWD